MMSGTPPVSIIIPAWNGRQFIDDCLASLLGQQYPDFEIIAVDNASEDGTAEHIAAHYEPVRLIRNRRNLGFAGGSNVGLKAATGQVMVLFNQDAVAQPGWLAALAAGLMAEPDIGLAGCKILTIDGQLLQHAGGRLTDPQAQPAHLGLDEPDSGQYDQPADVEYVTGAALAIRRPVIEAIGYLDEDFFFYYEDVDYCYRAHRAGFRVRYLPQAVVHHHSNSSLGRGTVDHHALFHASRLQFILKHRDAAYFTSVFQPVESDWFGQLRTQQERLGLRQAYQAMITRLLQPQYRRPWLDNRAELLAALGTMHRAIYTAYIQAARQPLNEPLAPPECLAEPWWFVRERPFVSPVPLIGPLIARFRTMWNDISTRWYVRPLLQQQNEINRLLLQQMEQQQHLLNRQAEILAAFDQDHHRLMVQLARLAHRLEEE